MQFRSFVTRPFRVVHAMAEGEYKYEEGRIFHTLITLGSLGVLTFLASIVLLYFQNLWGIGTLIIYLGIGGVLEFVHNQSRKKEWDETRVPEWTPEPADDPSTSLGTLRK